MQSLSPEDEHRRVRALTDAGLVAAMRDGDTWAWGEFGTRFEPVLLAYARRLGVPSEVRRERVLDLLADEGMRFAAGRGAVPAQLAAYLARALRHRYLNEKRSAARRAAAYDAAATSGSGALQDESDLVLFRRQTVPGRAVVNERVVEYACSEGTLRDARGTLGTPPRGSRTVEALVGHIRRHLSDDEQRILGWEERRVPHRQIAEWLGLSYDAATKRIWRLKRRLQALAVEYHARASTHEERRELERLFRRTGVSPVGTSVVTRIMPPHDVKETEP
jgi:DNA-directed RNA polymerase specialized sigma24 family protein